MDTFRIRRLGLGLTALALAATGCSSTQYLYRPEENATARVSGRPAAYYQVPPQSPHGDVRLATLGIARLQSRREDSEHIHAMHVRMVVDNNDDTAPWQVDTRQQIGSLDGYGQSRPAFASAGAARPPIVSIAPGMSERIDLYYPLPSSMQSASAIPHFEVLWHVQTPDGVVSERTTFERLEIEPQVVPPPGYYAGAGTNAWGPGWGGWYDPFWPGYSFWGAPIVYYTRPPMAVAPTPRGR
jgi:hypothetical protein